MVRCRAVPIYVARGCSDGCRPVGRGSARWQAVAGGTPDRGVSAAGGAVAAGLALHAPLSRGGTRRETWFCAPRASSNVKGFPSVLLVRSVREETNRSGGGTVIREHPPAVRALAARQDVRPNGWVGGARVRSGPARCTACLQN